jgi:hypothetical protein
LLSWRKWFSSTLAQSDICDEADESGRPVSGSGLEPPLQQQQMQKLTKMMIRMKAAPMNPIIILQSGEISCQILSPGGTMGPRYVL